MSCLMIPTIFLDIFSSREREREKEHLARLWNPLCQLTNTVCIEECDFWLKSPTPLVSMYFCRFHCIVALL